MVFVTEQVDMAFLDYNVSCFTKQQSLCHYSSVSQTFSTRVPLEGLALCLRPTLIWKIE